MRTHALLVLLGVLAIGCGSPSSPAMAIAWSFPSYSPVGNPSVVYPSATCESPTSFRYVVDPAAGVTSLACTWACGSHQGVEDGELLVAIDYTPPTWSATVYRLGDCR